MAKRKVNTSAAKFSPMAIAAVATLAANLRVNLNAVLREHTALDIAALTAQYLNSPSAGAAQTTVEQNSHAIANAVNSISIYTVTVPVGCSGN